MCAFADYHCCHRKTFISIARGSVALQFNEKLHASQTDTEIIANKLSPMRDKEEIFI
jgi:hypothetical protein